MPYDHSKPEIAAAYKAYQEILLQKPQWIQLKDHPDVLQAYAIYIGTLEVDGQIYAETSEIIFPPQLAEQCPFSGIVVPIHRILQWIIDECEIDGEHEKAKLYRNVILPFYPDPDDVDEDCECEDDDDDDDDSDGDPFSGLAEIFPIQDSVSADKAGALGESCNPVLGS
jgi:hypothetical protein|tara:strand:+ start:34756 stop:35262 length:507 start_codon:yes stop_codon:yes gene_type:complete